MIPTRPSRIFRSRWMALLWAAGVLWTAVEVVGFDDPQPAGNSQDAAALTDATGATVSNQDLAVLRDLIATGSK